MIRPFLFKERNFNHRDTEAQRRGREQLLLFFFSVSLCLCGCIFPAAAEGFIKCNKIGGQRALAEDELVFGDKELALGFEDAEEVEQAAVV